MTGCLQFVCPHCNAVNLVPSERMEESPSCEKCTHPLLPGEPLELTEETFDQHINNSDLPTLIDFWAPWCGPCRLMSPVVHLAAKELRTSVRVAKVNTETENGLAVRFGIRSIPTLMVIQSGEVVAKRAGATDLASLLKWVQSAIK